MELLGVLRVSVVVLLSCMSVVCAVLPAPKNIVIQTLNMNYVLKWDWDPDQVADSSHNVTFTAQYLALFKLRKPKNKQDWKSVCKSTPEHFCDFSSAQLHYLGMWMLRLRAQSGRNVSSWVKVEFCPDKDAILGPPSAVNITPINSFLQVAISDPLSITNGSMKEWLPNMYYFIQYWEKSSSTQKVNLTSANNLVILPKLESWTWYCVRVKSVDDYYKKTSVFSPVYCVRTDGLTPYWQIVLYFLVSLMLCFLVLLGVFTCSFRGVKFIKNTFFPSVPLPAPIQEYLCDSGSSDVPFLLRTDPELEICSDKLDLLPPVTEVILEVHLPPETWEQKGRTHSRQSSCDSGVYSTEGSGTMQN
ncbi:interferon alpha/beta receptor 1a-like [Neoarius graeffei]|uniref:interferon alpha/beta receptor 1a-like n=1 Tax=Neoarius graeffei TaxID=443677 RepID=UPI00298C8596|nr:interferon alpha/beta receptor 1a-like [Neoarius graeffei]